MKKKKSNLLEKNILQIEKESSPSILNTEYLLEPNFKGDMLKNSVEEKPVDHELLEFEGKLGRSNVTRFHYM